MNYAFSLTLFNFPYIAKCLGTRSILKTYQIKNSWLACHGRTWLRTAYFSLWIVCVIGNLALKATKQCSDNEGYPSEEKVEGLVKFAFWKCRGEFIGLGECILWAFSCLEIQSFPSPDSHSITFRRQWVHGTLLIFSYPGARISVIWYKK